ncbi:MAG: serine/threonine-protein kinase [Kofleriaceae bacterium]
MADERRSQDTADTVPAASAPGAHATSVGRPETDPETERPQRATMPDLARPFEQRYRLGAELGRGGMGRVVEAFDTQLGRTVALKEVLSHGSTVIHRRFEREVQITARLEHPSIVPLYDAGTMPDGRAFYVMRRVTGRPLDELIKRARDLEERLVLLPNVLAALDAIAHAHKRGIIHRDLKPANILVGENGETIVIDWGLAKVIGEEEVEAGDGMIIPSAADSLQTVAGAVFGTPGFMAPEQARGEELGPPGDVFALGATLYQLLVGRPPISGKSSTEAIASTIQRKIVPVAEAAPSAPVELVAIVEKALMFEPADRYQHAGGLAEDVRRFLTGQVVAAHRYTRRQMIARFAKRHRAPLSVAALAMVSLAVLAWIGVHRILVERDSANTARAEALSERSQVLKVNAQLVERADQLLITRARALIDSNPTESVALLKELRPTSPRLAEGRAIAQAAVHRGVPWALRAEGEPRKLVIDADVRHLAELTRDGALHVWDLDNHRVLYERMDQRDADAAWLTGGKLLLMRAQGCEQLDPRTGVISPIAQLPPAQRGLPSADGSRVAILASTGELGMFEVATQSWTPLWPGHVAGGFEIAPDASWVAATDKHGVVVVSAAGKVRFEHAGNYLLESANAHSVAMFDMAAPKQARVVEIDVEPAPTWHEDPLPLADKNFPFAAYYRAGNLHVVTATSILHYHSHALTFASPMVEFDAFSIPELGNGVEISASRDGSLHFVGNGLDGRIHMPVPLSSPHLVGRPGSTRFVAAGSGVVLVYDLADVAPQMIAKTGEDHVEFFDDDTLLMWPDDLLTFYARDLATGAVHPFKHELGPGTVALSIDPPSGRILLAEPSGQTQRTLVLVRKGHYDQVARFGAASQVQGRFAKVGFIAAHDHDPRVLYAEHDDKFTELAKVDGGVQSLMVLDTNRFAALGRSGELIRGTLAGGPLERIHVDIDANAFLGIDRAGHALVVTGTHVEVWDVTLRPLAELPRAALSIERVAGGLLAVLDNNAAYLIDDTAKVHEIMPASSAMPVVGGDGAWLASAGGGGQVTIVELPSLVRWTLPQVYTTSASLLVASPTKRRLVQAVPPELALWDLAEVSGDFAGWLDVHTNAFENADGFVSWPWLRP